MEEEKNVMELAAARHYEKAINDYPIGVLEGMYERADLTGEEREEVVRRSTEILYHYRKLHEQLRKTEEFLKEKIK